MSDRRTGNLFTSTRQLMGKAAKLSLVIAAVGCNASVSPAPAGAVTPQPQLHTYYVSKAAMQCHNDGSSWQMAWTELDKIDWSIVKPGDTIKIDGGAYPQAMYYATTLKVGADGVQGNAIKILSATEAGHDGFVQIEGYQQRRTGIDVGDHHDIQIQGGKWNSFIVADFKGDGINTGRNSDRIKLKNLTVVANGDTSGGVGIRLQGGENTLEQMIINDNAVNVDVYCTKGYFGPKINRCYISNQALWSGLNRVYNADGIRINDVPSSQQHLYITNSVLGPGLATAVTYGLKNSMLHVNNNLFINPKTANLVKTHRALPDYYYSILDFSNNTSFLTPLNAEGGAHSAIDFVQGQDLIFNNVAYGGAVAVTLTPQSLSGRSNGNVQYKTSGNIAFLAPTSVDPQFTSNVSSLPNSVSVIQQAALDFSLRGGSPATGKGSKITSRNQLLSTNE